MTNMTAATRYRLALLALEGLSIGDAFGQQFFGPDDQVAVWLDERSLPPAPWLFTDDTLMAASVCEVLARCGEIDQDELARSFCLRAQPERGYGATMRRLLARLANGEDWCVAAPDQFSGMGSHGNGAAMRVAPLGAYFHDDLNRVVDEAVKSAVVTHMHPDGVAGAIAVAVASAVACAEGQKAASTRSEFLSRVADRVPKGAVRRGIEIAMGLPRDASVRLAVSALGNGIQLSAADTVPLALWASAGWLGSLDNALWETVSGLGDRDTTCAIVGGIVALSVGSSGLPPGWLTAKEELPSWVPKMVTSDPTVVPELGRTQ